MSAPKPEPWTPEQDSFIRGHFAHLTNEELAASLGRTYYSIAKRLRQLGCRRTIKQKLDLEKRSKMLKGEGIWEKAGDVGLQLKQVLDKMLTVECEMVRWGKLIATNADTRQGACAFDVRIARERFAEGRRRLVELEKEYYHLKPDGDLTAFEISHPILDAM
jgi:hypothetical protein